MVQSKEKNLGSVRSDQCQKILDLKVEETGWKNFERVMKLRSYLEPKKNLESKRNLGKKTQSPWNQRQSRVCWKGRLEIAQEFRLDLMEVPLVIAWVGFSRVEEVLEGFRLSFVEASYRSNQFWSVAAGSMDRSGEVSNGIRRPTRSTTRSSLINREERVHCVLAATDRTAPSGWLTRKNPTRFLPRLVGFLISFTI